MCDWAKINALPEDTTKTEIPHSCGGVLTRCRLYRQYRAIDNILPYNLDIEGYVCSKCQKEFYTPEAIKTIIDTFNARRTAKLEPVAENIESYRWQEGLEGIDTEIVKKVG